MFSNIFVLILAMHSRSCAEYRYPILVEYRFDCNLTFPKNKVKKGKYREKRRGPSIKSTPHVKSAVEDSIVPTQTDHCNAVPCSPTSKTGGADDTNPAVRCNSIRTTQWPESVEKTFKNPSANSGLWQALKADWNTSRRSCSFKQEVSCL